MPIEVVRFGVGHRRPEGPPGTKGITGQVLHSDGRGLVSELAFARGGAITPHDNPNTTWFVVIEGGGWVAVGDERRRVAAGEAILWPANVIHAAWTDQVEMRAIVVEFTGPDDSGARLIGGVARHLGPGESTPHERGDGELAPPSLRDVDRGRDRSSGEPL